ncbi:MAG: hypothetical protein E2576_11095 [Alcaligenaceae bacterium]|nr:hypothetical protein [Alcaligenaceae bacterium SAGV5]MPS51246.1 hypothetical protein [Alcaligenaceae bacterium SAGV3]MPT57257.1 hypothetical protein [Alcaligenaceae bacterium]
MTLKEFLRTLKTREALQDFATRCDTTVGYLEQVAGGHRRAGDSLVVKIDRESGGRVPCETLRGDVDWGYLRRSSAKASPGARA